MIHKNCLNCTYFEGNQVELDENSETRDSILKKFNSAWCFHELSKDRTVLEMIQADAPCGKERVLWVHKPLRKDNEEL